MAESHPFMRIPIWPLLYKTMKYIQAILVTEPWEREQDLL